MPPVLDSQRLTDLGDDLGDEQFLWETLAIYLSELPGQQATMQAAFIADDPAAMRDDWRRRRTREDTTTERAVAYSDRISITINSTGLFVEHLADQMLANATERDNLESSPVQGFSVQASVERRQTVPPAG